MVRVDPKLNFYGVTARLRRTYHPTASRAMDWYVAAQSQRPLSAHRHGRRRYRLSLDKKSLSRIGPTTPPGLEAPLQHSNGRAYPLVLEYYEGGGGAELRFSYAFVENQTEQAVKAAREADAVVFFAGVDALSADEEKDFPTLALPEDQSRLLAAVQKANPARCSYCSLATHWF